MNLNWIVIIIYILRLFKEFGFLKELMLDLNQHVGIFHRVLISPNQPNHYNQSLIMRLEFVLGFLQIEKLKF